MARKKENKDEHKDKFDENINQEGMDTVENENSSEEEGLNRKKKKDDRKSGDGIEEFI